MLIQNLICMHYWPRVKSRYTVAGYLPSFFVRFYGPRWSRGKKKKRKKERGQYPAILTKQAGSIKVPISRTFSCETNGEIQMGKMGHLKFMPGIGSCLVSNGQVKVFVPIFLFPSLRCKVFLFCLICYSNLNAYIESMNCWKLGFSFLG